MIARSAFVAMFSIVIPVYNAERYLRRCIESILSQSHADYEAIFVDDGSTDRSAEIIGSFGDPRIRLLRQTNRGVSAARNLAIAKSRNAVIVFLDADDEWYPNHLGTLASLIGRYEKGGIYSTGYRMEYEDGSAPLEVFVDTGNAPYSVVRDPFRLWSVKQVNHCSNSAVRKSVLDEVGGFKEGKARARIRICGFESVHGFPWWSVRRLPVSTTKPTPSANSACDHGQRMVLTC